MVQETEKKIHCVYQKKNKMSSNDIPDLITSRDEPAVPSVTQTVIVTHVRFWMYLGFIMACYAAVLISWSFFIKKFVYQKDYDQVKWLAQSHSRIIEPFRFVSNSLGNTGMVLSNAGLVYNAPNQQWIFYDGRDPLDHIPMTLSQITVKSAELHGDIIPATTRIHSLGSSTHQWQSIWGANYETSDIRFKDDIKACSLSLDFIKQLNPIEYRMKDSSTQVRFGVSAQNVDGLLSRGKEYAMIQRDQDGYLSVKYTELIAPLINAVKQLSEEVDMLKSRLNAL